MIDCIWGLDDDPDSNVSHIAEHGLTPQDVDHAVDNYYYETVSRSSGRSIYVGPALDGRPIAVVYESVDEETIYPVTAYYK